MKPNIMCLPLHRHVGNASVHPPPVRLGFILLSISWLKPPALAGDFDLKVLNHACLGGCGFDDFNRQHPDYANPPA
ncbi:MAG: hypothetical protein Q8L02_03630, partial [Candidatus Nitrotoga sp.]|nr:hypothetical protein [Candidatus Nitrotoga sp.]